MGNVPPGLIMMLGALLLPFLPGRLRTLVALSLPVLSGVALAAIPLGETFTVSLFGYELTPVSVDKTSRVWGVIFHIAAFLGAIYSLHVKDTAQHVAGMVYAGSAIGAVFAGDLITLFVYWELTAVSSVFLVWASRGERSFRAGMRYLVFQVGSGVLLLAGVILRVAEMGPAGLAFGAEIPEGLMGLEGLKDLSTALIFLAFGIKAAFPFLHTWLQDAYPEATPTGTVFLSAFTTKLAIYSLLRGFAGAEELIWIGASMTAFPIFYAVIENDLRRVLSYSLINQLGFMIVGIGIGTPLALIGTAAHAFAHILYKGLLFMSMGAVLHRTGTVKGSELGGLYKSMPWTMVFCCVGAASISAFPLFSGFVTKSMILTAAIREHHTVVYLILLFASAGVFHHSGIKIPYFAFFAHDSGIRVKEAPWNMLLAMGLTAALCIGIGCWAGPLYALLPHHPSEFGFHAYTTPHVMAQLQLLLFSALAFAWLNRTGLYPPELRSTNVDSDWTYRRALPGLVRVLSRTGSRIGGGLARGTSRCLASLQAGIREFCGPTGVFARTWPTGSVALCAGLVLGGYLLMYYL